MNKTKMTSLAKWTLFLTMIDSKFDVTGKTSIKQPHDNIWYFHMFYKCHEYKYINNIGTGF